MAKAAASSTIVWIPLSEALELTAARFGSETAKELLREWRATGKLPGRCKLWKGPDEEKTSFSVATMDHDDPKYWRTCMIDWKNNMTFAPVSGANGLWEEVSRTHLVALLHEAPREREEAPEPTDAVVPAPSAGAPAATPAPKRVAEAEEERCFRAIMKERPNDPLNEKDLLAEMKRRLGDSPVRQRVRDLWRVIAPQWKRPVGAPRNKISAKKSAK